MEIAERHPLAGATRGSGSRRHVPRPPNLRQVCVAAAGLIAAVEAHAGLRDMYEFSQRMGAGGLTPPPADSDPLQAIAILAEQMRPDDGRDLGFALAWQAVAQWAFTDPADARRLIAAARRGQSAEVRLAQTAIVTDALALRWPVLPLDDHPIRDWARQTDICPDDWIASIFAGLAS